MEDIVFYSEGLMVFVWCLGTCSFVKDKGELLSYIHANELLINNSGFSDITMQFPWNYLYVSLKNGNFFDSNI